VIIIFTLFTDIHRLVQPETITYTSARVFMCVICLKIHVSVWILLRRYLISLKGENTRK